MRTTPPCPRRRLGWTTLACLLLSAGSIGLARPTLAADDGVWRPLAPPLPRAAFATIYDPSRARVVVFGGNQNSQASTLPANDTWALSTNGAPVWSPIPCTGPLPPSRDLLSGIYDAAHDRMVIFGGYLRNDTWALNFALQTWTELTPAGTPPSNRYAHVAIADPLRDRMLVFGGTNGFTPNNEVWQLSLGASPTWTLLSPAGTPPSARSYASAIYDPVRDRMLVFGGATTSGMVNEVWSLSLSGTPTWALLTAGGTPPSGRFASSAVYDAGSDRMIVHAGSAGPSLNDTWALSLSGAPQWSLVDGAGTSAARNLHGTAYDPVNQRLIVCMGSSFNFRRDTWALALTGSPTWTLLTPAQSPLALIYAGSALDAARHRWLLVGGNGSVPVVEVWAYALSGVPGWSLLADLPAPRTGATAVVDGSRDRLIVFGGRFGTGGTDVLQLPLASGSWSTLATAGTPPTDREQLTAVYDAPRDRIVYFGGLLSGGAVSNQVWALTLSGTPTWSMLTPVGTPPSARQGASAVYDAAAQRMLVFGGSAPGPAYSSELWQLSLAGTPAWTLLSPGPGPSARVNHTAVIDSVRHRMLLYGGYGGGYSAELWSFALTGPPTWSLLAPGGNAIGERQAHAAVFDPVIDRMYVHGGLASSGNAWVDPGFELRFDLPLATPGPRDLVVEPAFRLSPNPARQALAITFAAPRGADARVDVLDLSGRRVATPFAGTVSAGEHRVAWDGRRTNGARVAAGAYFVRLRLGDRVTARRFVWLN